MDRTFWVFHFKTYIIFAFSRMRLWRAIIFMEQSANISGWIDKTPIALPKFHMSPLKKKKSVPSSPKKKQGPLPNIIFLTENLLKTHEESQISTPRVMYRKVLRPCDIHRFFVSPRLGASKFSKGGSTVHSWEWGRVSDNETYNWVTAGYTLWKITMASPTKEKMIGTHQTGPRGIMENPAVDQSSGGTVYWYPTSRSLGFPYKLPAL